MIVFLVHLKGIFRRKGISVENISWPLVQCCCSSLQTVLLIGILTIHSKPLTPLKWTLKMRKKILRYLLRSRIILRRFSWGLLFNVKLCLNISIVILIQQRIMLASSSDWSLMKSCGYSHSCAVCLNLRKKSVFNGPYKALAHHFLVKFTCTNYPINLSAEKFDTKVGLTFSRVNS